MYFISFHSNKLKVDCKSLIIQIIAVAILKASKINNFDCKCVIAKDNIKTDHNHYSIIKF